MSAFVVLHLVFLYQAKSLAWGTSPKWSILCRVGRKTLTQSINVVQSSKQFVVTAGLPFVKFVIWPSTVLRRRFSRDLLTSVRGVLLICGVRSSSALGCDQSPCRLAINTYVATVLRTCSRAVLWDKRAVKMMFIRRARFLLLGSSGMELSTRWFADRFRHHRF